MFLGVIIADVLDATRRIKIPRRIWDAKLHHYLNFYQICYTGSPRGRNQLRRFFGNRLRGLDSVGGSNLTSIH